MRGTYDMNLLTEYINWNRGTKDNKCTNVYLPSKDDHLIIEAHIQMLVSQSVLWCLEYKH